MSVIPTVYFLYCFAANVNSKSSTTAGNQGTSPASALKELSDPKLILGSGVGHLLTRPYTEIRQESFNCLHEERLKYKQQEQEETSW